MSLPQMSCAWSDNNSVIAGVSTQSTISSTTKTPTFIQLTEQPFDPPTRRTVYNPYTNEYISKRSKKKSTLRQMRITNGADRYDEVWVGDTLDKNKPNNIVRFWIQNVNGLVHNNDLYEFQHEIADLADRNINYFSFTETCTNYNKPGYCTQIKHAFSQILPNGQLKLANTPNYPITSSYQPGGIAGGFDGTLRERYLREGSDPCGRWVWQEFGDSHCNTRIHTFYRVINGSVDTSGSTTAWAQQKLYFDHKAKSGNPRVLAVDDMVGEVRGLISNGYNIIINGDFNESILSPEKLNEKLEAVGLYNLMTHHLDTKELPRTFNRGKSAIHHIYVTRHILENIHRAGYAPFDEGFVTDHRGIFFDISDEILFPNDNLNIVHHEFRKLKSNDPKSVEKYLKQLDEDWTAHKILQKYKKLCQDFKNNGITDENVMNLNKLDQHITEIMISAERKCTHITSKHPEHWSPALATAIKKKKVWKKERKKRSKVLNGQSIVDAIISFKEACTQFRLATQELKLALKNSKSLRAEFLKKRAEDLAKKNNTNAANELKKILHIEKQRNQAVAIQAVLKRRGRGGPSSILIPAPTEYDAHDGTPDYHLDIDRMWDRLQIKNGHDIKNWIRISNREKMEELMLQWQRKHFEQANETPLATTA